MKRKGLIIAAFAGTGKTYLAKKYKNVIDLESSKYKYDYSMYSSIEYEKLKGDKNRIPNNEWPQNYVTAINEAQTKYDIVFVFICEEALNIYKKYNIDFVVSYPSECAFKMYYKSRYQRRGNSDAWIESVLSYYDKFITNFLQKSEYKKIILNNDETLEVSLKNLGYELIPY